MSTTTNDLDQTRRAATDTATLAIRRASVRLFMQADPDAQRRALAEASDDPAAIRLALRMIGADAQDVHACHCCTPRVRLDPKQAPRPPEQGTP